MSESNSEQKEKPLVGSSLIMDSGSKMALFLFDVALNFLILDILRNLCA